MDLGIHTDFGHERHNREGHLVNGFLPGPIGSLR
jgi:hypothetical protein